MTTVYDFSQSCQFLPTDHATVRGDFCPMFQTMSKIGFFRSITDPAGFLQILCTSVSHMTTLQHQAVANSPEAIALSTQAIQSVNKRLSDPVLYTSDGMVAAILTFCCHTVSDHTIFLLPKAEQYSHSCEDNVQRYTRLKGSFHRARRDHSTPRGTWDTQLEPIYENGSILVSETNIHSKALSLV